MPMRKRALCELAKTDEVNEEVNNEVYDEVNEDVNSARPTTCPARLS